MWMWIGWLTVFVGVLGVLGWQLGWVGASPVLTRRRASARLRAIAAEVVSSRTLGEETGATSQPRLSDNPDATAPTCGRDGDPANGQTQTVGHPSLLDAAVPGGLAFVAGAVDWLTPDQAAMDAVAHMTGEQISGALDLHTTLSGRGYDLLSEGSLVNWRGHVGEAQVAEQVESWAGEGAVQMPENANFPGADLSLFGRDFQVKFGQDFNDIDNAHGDALIVAEDTANIPEDALHIDLSQAFDPAQLDGHGVIVAEGLTLAGAEDAWETAAGLWAGGLDAGDVADASGAALIPGMGAAIRVGMSGYRRRAALTDPELRDRAMGRVARDAAYGAGGAGAGGMIGGLAGGLIDVVTFGATGGAGYWIGTAIGAAVGGKAGGEAARDADAAVIERKRKAVNAALAHYGTALEAAEKRAQDEWNRSVADAQALAAESAETRLRHANDIRRLASADLEQLQTMSHREAHDLVESAKDGVASVQPRSPRGRRAVAAWHKSALLLREPTKDGGAADAEAVLLATVAVPGGDALVREWLLERLERRAVVLASMDHCLSAIRTAALRDRVELASDLAIIRKQVHDKAEKALSKPVAEVARETDRLKEELTVNGYL